VLFLGAARQACQRHPPLTWPFGKRNRRASTPTPAS
jgi:hypothetical protein